MYKFFFMYAFLLLCFLVFLLLFFFFFFAQAARSGRTTFLFRHPAIAGPVLQHVRNTLITRFKHKR